MHRNSRRCIRKSPVIIIAALLIYQPITWAQTPDALITHPNTEMGDRFGTSVAGTSDVSGDYLVIGAKDEDSSATGVNGDPNNNNAEDSGAAYVYVQNLGMWTLQAYLKASNTGEEDEFGSAVAISGNTIVVGAPDEQSGVNGGQNDNSANRAGAAYVFVRSGTTWTQQAYLKAPVPGSDDRFGSAVGIDGDTIVVGAIGESSFQGAAYVFTRNGTTWEQQAKLQASNPGFLDNFGNAVAIDGNQIAVGARQEASDGSPPNDNLPQSGAVYIFTRSGSAWEQKAIIKSSNPDNPIADPNALEPGQQFGYALDLSGNTLAVGAPFEASSSTGIDGNQINILAPQSGAVYLFEGFGGSWTQTAYIKASNTDAFDQFGKAVALSGPTLAVGAVNESSNAINQGGDESNNSLAGSGAVYIFERDSMGDWSQKYYDKPFAAEANLFFGSSVDVFGELVAIGATGAISQASSAGAVYTYEGVLAAPDFKINSGVNDAWVSDDAPFQGMFFTVFESLGSMFLSWFTFDSMPPGGNVTANFGAPDQRWVTALGTINGDTANLQVELTFGGTFNSDAMVADQDADYGTMTIKFLSCNEAIVTYNIPSLGLSGQFTATRVLTSSVAMCEAMQ